MVAVRAGHLAIAGEPFLGEQNLTQGCLRYVEIEAERQWLNRLLTGRVELSSLGLAGRFAHAAAE